MEWLSLVDTAVSFLYEQLNAGKMPACLSVIPSDYVVFMRCSSCETRHLAM